MYKAHLKTKNIYHKELNLPAGKSESDEYLNGDTPLVGDGGSCGVVCLLAGEYELTSP